jgi:hypothetical protein
MGLDRQAWEETSQVASSDTARVSIPRIRDEVVTDDQSAGPNDAPHFSSDELPHTGRRHRGERRRLVDQIERGGRIRQLGGVPHVNHRAGDTCPRFLGGILAKLDPDKLTGFGAEVDEPTEFRAGPAADLEDAQPANVESSPLQAVDEFALPFLKGKPIRWSS